MNVVRATATVRSRTTNIAASRAIRATNRSTSRGRQVRGEPPVKRRTKRGRGAMIMDRVMMTTVRAARSAAAGAGCTRVQSVVVRRAVGRGASASGR